MGCDIHIHQEIKIDGQWEHYRETKLTRDYQTFAKMAGVRGSERPIAEPRGLPDDVTKVTKFDADLWGDDGHSHSWLGAAEIAEMESWITKENKWRLGMDGWGYLFGNLWGDFTKYPEDMPKGLEDIRFVFWFDN